jgi:micrococcal nuclease
MWTYYAKVAKVVDGDTLDLDVDLGFRITHRIRVRLARVDAPEMSTDLGKELKKRMMDEFAGSPDVTIRTNKGDKYGRWIAEVEVVGGPNLSDWLLLNGYAEPY